MKNKKKIRIKNIILLIAMLFFLGIFIFSTIKIINYLKDNKDNKKIQQTVNKSIIINEDDSTEEKKYEVDFKSLKEKNPDTVAYLKVEGTNIDYVVVKGNNNDFYLNHNFNKDYNVSGWIFADYRNEFNGNDQNIIVYGHNTHDNSMFGTLNKVLEKEWQGKNENHSIVFVTENDASLYQVFSTYKIAPEEYYITTSFKDEIEYQDYLNKILSRSNYNYNVSVTKNDKILTLSSCAENGKKRVVLHAKKIEKSIS